MVMIFCLLVIISIPVLLCCLLVKFLSLDIFIVVDLEWKIIDDQCFLGKHVDIFGFIKMSSQLRRLYKVDFGIIIFNDILELCESVF
jgi:hypothetical protein